MRSTGSIPILPVTMIVATALIAVSLGAYVVYFGNTHEPADEGAFVVETGDEVTVDYVGMFQNGKVFDTSIESVAYNDALYPKSVSYDRRSAYAPMSFSLGAGQMVKGFETGIIGMHIGETRDIVVDPVDGYGESNPQMILTKPLVEAVPVYQFGVSLETFNSDYGVSASAGVTVVHKFWGWNVSVYNLDLIGGTVTLKHMPEVGDIVKPYGDWSCKVESIDESANSGTGRITVRNMLAPSDVNAIMGKDSNGQEFRVTSLDLQAETFVADYNMEVVGQTLLFRVTMISATRPGS